MRTVSSVRNPAVKAARKLARPGRDAGDRFLVEGPHAVAEGLARLERLFVTTAAAREHAGIVDRARRQGVDVTAVSEQVCDAIATTVTCQGLVGVAHLAAPSLHDALAGAGLVLVCWEVRDPGNAGAIIRTADAAGAGAVVLAGDSVDPRNPKAVRASAGSLFHLPVVDRVSWEEVAAACRAAGLTLVAADAGAALHHTDVDLARPTALVVGNEAHGLDPRVEAGCDLAVSVPIHGRAESLNLAAAVAVLMYEAARQRAAAAVRP
jgi:TrmH family RNA methyltransferase